MDVDSPWTEVKVRWRAESLAGLGFSVLICPRLVSEKYMTSVFGFLKCEDGINQVVSEYRQDSDRKRYSPEDIV
jgi:hypothetical protein